MRPQYVETLQEQLDDLKSSGKIDPELLGDYQKRTAALSASLRRADVSDLSRILASLQPASRAGEARPTGAEAGPAEPRAVPGPAAPRPPAAVTVPKSVPKPPSQEPLKPISLSKTAQARIGAQERAHEALTDELVGLAAAMKSNTLAMEAKVKEREELLETTETALDKSATETRTAATRATGMHRRGRRNFCLTCLVLFIIAVGFVGMYVFIRITSLTGYKAARPTAAVPVPVPVPSPPPVDAVADPGPQDYHYDL